MKLYVFGLMNTNLQAGDIVLIPNPDAIAGLESRKLHIDHDSKIDDYFW